MSLSHLAVGIAQPIEPSPPAIFGVNDGQVAGLEQQRFSGDVIDIKRREQLVAAFHAVQVQRTDVALAQRLDQKRRRAGLKPVGFEQAAVEQQQDVEGVVHLLVAPRFG